MNFCLIWNLYPLKLSLSELFLLYWWQFNGDMISFIIVKFIKANNFLHHLLQRRLSFCFETNLISISLQLCTFSQTLYYAPNFPFLKPVIISNFNDTSYKNATVNHILGILIKHMFYQIKTTHYSDAEIFSHYLRIIYKHLKLNKNLL